MARIYDDERCSATVLGGGRGYVTQRCKKRAVDGDPDQLCRMHRVERDGYGHPAAQPDAESRWAAERDLEDRLAVVSRHLEDFFGLRTLIDYDRGSPRGRPTGRLVVDVDDLLRILDAQDLMPRRWFVPPPLSGR